jgi:hypothetical protein
MGVGRFLVESGLPLAGGIVGAGGELGWPNPTRPGDVSRLKAKSNGRWALGKQTHPYREDARCDRRARCILSIVDACLFQC